MSSFNFLGRSFLPTCLLAVVYLTSHAAIPAPTLEDAAKVEWQWHIAIPTRDGIRLSGTLYKPAELKESRPCIFTLTPYIAQSYHARGMYFASHGYPFLTVDSRGRGNSEGSFRPLIQEAQDGYDVVEWLAKQPYCNGKVAMWGGSYAGYDQWAVAKEFPPHLATIVPVASAIPGVDFPGFNNIFAPYDIQWLAFTSGRTSQENIFSDGAFWATSFRRWIESGTAFRKLDAFVGTPSPIFQEWVAHPDLDSYWDAYTPTAEQYAKLTLPILTITGMYDADQAGALAQYSRYMQAASPQARARHFLVIGPWDHPGTRTPKQEFLGMKFGPASLVDLPQLHLDWYRHTMEGGAKPDFLQKPVAYYVTGAEKWRYAETLEAITADVSPWFLDSAGGAAQNVYAAGSLSPGHVGRGQPDQYRYDPRDVSLARVEAPGELDSVLNQAALLANKAQVVYVSAPFEQDTELSGFFRLDAWLSTDQPDTDFLVRVTEIAPDGKLTALSSDVMRARYRESRRTQRLITTKDPLRYDFSHFTFASRLVVKGSRLQLVLSAANTRDYEKNFNSGGVIADETVADSRVVAVKLFHDAKRRSVLYVPIAAKEVALGN